jgi:hypothetical protein
MLRDFRRVEYGCTLCPKENRPNFGDPEKVFPALILSGAQRFGGFVRQVTAHILAVHPSAANPVRPINDFLAPTYFSGK